MHQRTKPAADNVQNITLSIETNYRGIFDAAGKRLDYIQFVKKGYLNYFSRIVTKITDQQQSRELIRIINQFDYLFQIHDSTNDLFATKKSMQESFIELRSDILNMVRGLASATLNLFDDIYKNLHSDEHVDVRGLSKDLQETLDNANRELLELLADPFRKDAGTLTNFITYSQRLKDKLENYYRVQRYTNPKTEVV